MMSVMFENDFIRVFYIFIIFALFAVIIYRGLVLFGSFFSLVGFAKGRAYAPGIEEHDDEFWYNETLEELHLGKKVSLNDYLQSNKYIKKNQPFFWDSGSSPESGDLTDNISDNYGCHWRYEYDRISSYLYLVKPNGEYLNFDCTLQLKPEKQSEHPIELSITFQFAYTTDGYAIEEVGDPYFKIQEIKQSSGNETNNTIQEDGSAFYWNNLLIKSCRDFYSFACNEASMTSLDGPLGSGEAVLFKHHNQLLNSKDLAKECWFRRYHTPSFASDNGVNAVNIANYQNPDITLTKEDMPYLWWLTNNIPHKEGYIAFQDVHGNAFYVGDKKNVGEVVVYQGKPVVDEIIEIHIIFNGYFDITTNKTRKPL